MNFILSHEFYRYLYTNQSNEDLSLQNITAEQSCYENISCCEQ